MNLDGREKTIILYCHEPLTEIQCFLQTGTWATTTLTSAVSVTLSPTGNTDISVEC